MLLCILLCEVGTWGPPRLVIVLLQVVQFFGFEQVAGVHLYHKVVQFFGLGDYAPIVLAFHLMPVQLAGEGFDVGVGSVAPELE